MFPWKCNFFFMYIFYPPKKTTTAAAATTTIYYGIIIIIIMFFVILRGTGKYPAGPGYCITCAHRGSPVYRRQRWASANGPRVCCAPRIYGENENTECLWVVRAVGFSCIVHIHTAAVVCDPRLFVYTVLHYTNNTYIIHLGRPNSLSTRAFIAFSPENLQRHRSPATLFRREEVKEGLTRLAKRVNISERDVGWVRYYCNRRCEIRRRSNIAKLTRYGFYLQTHSENRPNERHCNHHGHHHQRRFLCAVFSARARA